MTPGGEKPYDISQIAIEEEMKRSYLDYAMSVIVSRALPDVRDGLKPVHRRILFSMHENGYDSTKPYRKSARIVGDVMGKYHPHGDQAIYDAMVRMAQDFSMRLPLIDGQGNFGSMDGDPAAAMRYTEARLAKAAESLIDDIDKETVDFQANYDESAHEPLVLPARYPNLLVNGAGGIAVGMATNIPPHNLGEVIDACLAYLDNPGITIEELLDIVPGPDFPTGALILGRAGIRAAYHTGRGSVVMRGRTHVETVGKDRESIVVTEIPYQVNKARMLERIAELVRDKTIEGISDLRDESDRDGVRVVVELKRDAMADVVLAQLYRFSPLQTSFGVNMLALDGGRPLMMTLRDIIAAFIRFREEVVTRRTIFELRKARERAHVLAGLLVAINNIDPVIELIRAAPDPAAARQQLMERDWPAEDVAPFIRLIDDPGHQVIDGNYRLSEMQARAILDLRLQRLTGMERGKLADETKEIAGRIEEYLTILQSRETLLGVIRDELTAMRVAFADERRTTIEDVEFEQDIEDLIQREEMVVTVSHGGYIKRVPLSTYRAQRRGGKGRAGMSTREGDFVSRVFVTSTHTRVLFFSTRGIVYELKVYKLPLGSPQARGKAMVNLLPLTEGETISTVMLLPEDDSEAEASYVMFSTSGGNVRRNSLSDFTNIKANGKIAMKLQDDERLVNVRVCNENQDVLLASRSGMCIRFPVTDVRVFTGRTSTGVRGIRLGKGDEVISMSVLEHVGIDIEKRDAYLRIASAMRRAGEDGETEAGDLPALPQEDFDRFAAAEEFILVVTEKGFGKRTSAYEYRITGRGGKGIGNIDVTDRNGPVVAAFPIERNDQLMIVTNGGQLIRCPVDDIRIAGRLTQGVTVLRVGEEERVVSVARLREDGEDGENDDEGAEAEDAGDTGEDEPGDEA
jgi:DNA gyrase subunit A